MPRSPGAKPCGDPALDDTLGFSGAESASERKPVPSPSTTDPLIGMLVGQYRIIRQLGAGGMGVVYEAQHESIGQRAAVKVLRAKLSADAEFIKRFHNEARAAIIAQHAGLVKIFDYGQLPNSALYILMEFLEGESLGKRLARLGRMAEPDAVRTARQIAAAMAVAHDKGIVHRDLKPDNIFVVPDGEAMGGERAKILDFGLAKILPRLDTSGASSGVKSTRSEVLLGSPAYMSPEQCSGPSQVDSKADVYSLGIMMFEMLTGALPYKAQTVDAMVECHLDGTPAELGEYVPDGSPAVARLVRSMLIKKPENRPSMLEVANALSVLDPLGTEFHPAQSSEGAASTTATLWTRVLSWSFIAKAGGTALVATLCAPLLFLLLRTRSSLPPLSEVMAQIPGGTFQMGSTSDETEAAFAWCNRLVSDGCQKEQFYREYPTRQVTLSAFELDQVEVDNQHFADWLNRQPQLIFQPDQKKVFKGSILLVDLYTMYGHGSLAYRQGRFVPLRGFEHRPVTQVTWDAAVAYCRDHGKRLPTEAEWEYAAQGAQGFRFPWGDEEPRCDGVVFARHPGWACGNANPGSENLGTAAQDRSPQGVRDLAGNASEWVQDMFAGGYPSCLDGCRDPVAELQPGDDPVGLRVVRGGDWHTAAVTCRAASRSRVAHNTALPNVGFRCARSQTKK